jgi:hypothetical protein
MRMKNILSAGALALSLVSVGIVPAFADTVGSLSDSFSGSEDTDVWEVKCTGADVTCLNARVRDRSLLLPPPFNLCLGHQIGVTNIGLTPGSVKGEADLEKAPTNCSFSPSAQVCRPIGSPGAIKTWVVVSQLGGATGRYTLEVTCVDGAKAPTFKEIQDED